MADDVHTPNPPVKVSRSTLWARANRERHNARGADYRAKHPDEAKESVRKYDLAHREERLLKARELRLKGNNNLAVAKYRAKNRELVRAYSAKYSKENPEVARANSALRRARKLACLGRYSKTDIERIGRLQKWKCAYCKRGVKEKYHIDHVVPLSLGGDNGPRNIQITCIHCNSQKHNKDPVEFAQKLGLLI